MTGELSYDLRAAMTETAAGLTPAESLPNYEVALLSAGVEIGGNGYARATVAVGTSYVATWARSGTTATITTTHNHYLTTGDNIEVLVTSASAAIPVGSYAVTVTGANTFTIVCLNAGATSGTITAQPPAFWLVVTSTDQVALGLEQIKNIVWSAAASGGNWTFNEIRLIPEGTSGSYAMRFLSPVVITVPDGDTLTIAAGTLFVDDLGYTLP